MRRLKRIKLSTSRVVCGVETETEKICAKWVLGIGTLTHNKSRMVKKTEHFELLLKPNDIFYQSSKEKCQKTCCFCVGKYARIHCQG